MMVRENSDELTLRAEEVGTLKAYFNVNHIEEERCGPMSTLGRAPERSNCCVGQSPEVRGRSALKVAAQALGERSVPQQPMMTSVDVCGRSRSGRASGPTWMRWILCVCAQCKWSSMCQRSRRIVTSMLSKCSEMLILGTDWET